MTFLPELKRLMDAATKNPNIGTYSDLRKYLGKHAPALAELVESAEQVIEEMPTDDRCHLQGDRMLIKALAKLNGGKHEG